MTEYWVSQKRKWCEYCKIFLADNVASLQMHQSGERHKENVARRISTIRRDAMAADREKKQAARDMQQIETAAKRQYEKDLAAQQQAAAAMAGPAPAPSDTNAGASEPAAPASPGEPPEEEGTEPPGSPAEQDEWVQDEATGYYYNSASGYYYDASSGLYYSDILGKWTTQEEALQASRGGAGGASTTAAAPAVTATPASADRAPPGGQSPAVASQGPTSGKVAPRAKQPSSTSIEAMAAAPGVVRKAPAVPGRVGRGVASSIELVKRKREASAAAGPLSAEEVAAREAREAARRRTEERDKRTLGLYSSF